MLFQKKKKRKGYSNTKVKTRNLLTNIFYRRFKQSNFKKDSFIIDILSYLLQKLEIEKERDIVKFLWDDCITQDFVPYMNKLKNYVIISKPNITYQKANDIVKNFFKEDPNRINLLKYKIEEKFKLIHYVYSLLFSKIYNRTSQFEIQNKNTFKNKIHRKQNGPIAAKILNQLSQNQANQIATAVLSEAKDPKDYKGRKVNKNEQAPIHFEVPAMVQTKFNDNLSKKTAEKQKNLERQLSENTIKMNKTKTLKTK